MGAITPIASGLGSAVSTLNTIGNVVNTVQSFSGNSAKERDQDLALRQLQQRQQLENQQAINDAALDRQQIELQAAQDEEERRDALRRAVARQRANFGSQGVSQTGSAQAVLLGLFEESDEERANRDARDQLRFSALEQDTASTQSLNVLQATQLRERQNLASQANIFGRLF